MKTMSLSYAPGMFRFVDRSQQYKIRLLRHQLNLLLAAQRPSIQCHRDAAYNQFPWKWRDPAGFRAHLQASPQAPLRLHCVPLRLAYTAGSTSSSD
jgi:hypothetical protein